MYGAVSADSYQVVYTFIQDCSNSQPDSILNLQIISPGCNSGRYVVLRKVNAGQILNLFCPNQPNYCSNGGSALTSFTYTAIVTFSPAEQTCADWSLRVLNPTITRPATANLDTAGTVYTEAYLYLSNSVMNNSVQFDSNNIPLAFFLPNQQNTFFSLNAYEFDTGDSLAYSLIQPQNGPGMPVNYKPGYSSQVPMQTVSGISFNAATGQLRFTSPGLVQNVPGDQGANRYAVAFEIREYRKINGKRRIVGIVRREMIFEIVPAPPPNHDPQYVNFTINGQPFNPNQVQYLLVGQQSIIHFETIDPDLSDSLVLDINADSSSCIISASIGKRPEVTISWTPKVFEERSFPYYFNFQLNDIGCPIRNIISKSLMFYVVNPTGLESERDADFKFTVFPNPFSKEVTFRFANKPDAFSEVIIRNVLGQEIERITLQNTAGGEQEINWKNASAFPAGQYLAQLIGKYTLSRQVKFMKLP
jgi:hypothetical protein